MKNKKVKAIAAGAIVVVVVISIFLQYEVSGNLYESESIGIKTTEESRSIYTNDDVTQDKIFDLILRNKDFNNKFLSQQKETIETSGTEEQEEVINDIVNILQGIDKETVYNIIITGKDDENDREYLPEPAYSINKSVVSKTSVQLPVSYLSQYPELPTGCEVTSLTTVLNYLGYNVSKETMANNYLPKCSLEEGSFWNYFLGDPTDEHAFGCYSKPIITAANSFLKEKGSTYSAYNYSGSGFETFLKEIEAGNPVILWSTMNLEKAYITFRWNINDENVQWIAPEHCVVMTGYDLDANTVTISDPMQGIVILDMDMVNLRYMQMCSQAVVIRTNTIDGENATKATEETQGATQGATQGTSQGATQGTSQGTTEGTSQVATEGTTQGTQEATLEGIHGTTAEGMY